MSDAGDIEADFITPVILSGGSGTRLWPVSSDQCPKQFLELVGPQSMFQYTLRRCEDTEFFTPPIIVGSAEHADLAEEQLAETGVDAGKHILEPCARNTAPAIALAALAAEKPHTPLLVMPSDHIIKDVPAFRKAVLQSLPLAKAHWLVTFGIEPQGPDTGYGYIQQGSAIIGSENSFSTLRFVEKPNRDNAEKMLDEGGYHWNAGIFLFRADVYLSALDQFAPEMHAATSQAMESARQDNSRIYPDMNSFAEAPADSIDYAIMERAEKVAVTPVNPGWSDVGSWDSLYDVSEKDGDLNSLKGEALAVASKGNFIQADDLQITTYGVDDMIIVARGKTVLIVPRGESQNVKKIIAELKQDD